MGYYFTVMARRLNGETFEQERAMRSLHLRILRLLDCKFQRWSDQFYICSVSPDETVRLLPLLTQHHAYLKERNEDLRESGSSEWVAIEAAALDMVEGFTFAQSKGCGFWTG